MSQNEIVSETNYYPFGLAHKGYNEVQNSTNKGEDYKFNGKELNDEFDLGWYDFGARPYMPDINRTPTIDPLAEDPTQIDKSPYAMFWNNPISNIDPTGMMSWDWREDEWIPKVNSDGSTSYIAEAGDSAATLSSQYGIDISQAEAITGTSGTNEIAAGTEVSGQDVANVTGSEVLKLDVASKEGQSEQRRFDQFLYARDHSTTKGGYAFLNTDYFSNTNFMGMMSGSATMQVGGDKLPIKYQIPMYRAGTFDGSSTSVGLSNSAFNIKYTSGVLFKGNQANIELELYHPNGNYSNQQYRIFSTRQNSNKVYERLRATFPKYRYSKFKPIIKN